MGVIAQGYTLQLAKFKKISHKLDIYSSKWHPTKVLRTIATIDEMTADITAGQNKSSGQKIALEDACAPTGPMV